MKFKILPFNGKTLWQDNKAFIWFALSLLLIYSTLKIIFYNYNYSLLFSGNEESISTATKIRMIKWSLLYDLITIAAINLLLLLSLQAGRLVSAKISSWFILPLFVLLNSFAVLLNAADIFYFRFHFQRANADLLYVLNHPLKQLFHFNIFIIVGFAAAIGGIIFLIWKLHKKFFTAFVNGKHGDLITAVLLLYIGLTVLFNKTITKFLVPTFPLVELSAEQLPVVQNSFHTFTYSVFRNGETVYPKNYFSEETVDSLYPIRKTLSIDNAAAGKKNIVLFIMESVPYDFFDTAGPYKVVMPFFDSLLQKSILYNNAFAYAHQSNKGITAILAGIPTIADIPIYHSAFVNMPLTHIGVALKKNHYHSFFCIGDEYDNFGFAKCINWLGIDRYYSREDIPTDKKIPEHSMGLQDETVLNFMQQKLNEVQQPFFAINYNISTHYPYNIPASFSADLPANYTAPMKSMRYYDHSLQQFFSKVKNEPWFKKTVFIFCSDHWLVPDDNRIEFDAITGYRIPVIIYEPAINERRTDNRLVSQFDIMGTILSIADYKDSIISYGYNLLDSSSNDEVVFSRANANLYHAIDSSYILGFNYRNDKAEFLYRYKTDTALKKNLLTDINAQAELKKLSLKVKAFLQKANMQYNNAGFK